MGNTLTNNKLVSRYAFISKTVNNIYIDNSINKFPVNIESVLKSFENIKVKNYSDLMLDFNLTASQTIKYLSSNDGCCVKKISDNRFIIFINDLTYISDSRKLWTVVHELGHIVLNHADINISNYSESEIYEFKEHEANYFTSLFLAHPAVLKEMDIRSARDIEVFCNLSKEAANYRYKSYKNYKSKGFLKASDKIIIENFKKFIGEKNNDYIEYKNFMNAFYV